MTENQKLPEIKKKISSYLSLEDGKISKEAVIAVGAFVTSAAISTALLTKNAAASHDNVVDINYNSATAVGTHTHQINPDPAPAAHSSY